MLKSRQTRREGASAQARCASCLSAREWDARVFSARPLQPVLKPKSPGVCGVAGLGQDRGSDTAEGVWPGVLREVGSASLYCRHLFQKQKKCHRV